MRNIVLILSIVFFVSCTATLPKGKYSSYDQEKGSGFDLYIDLKGYDCLMSVYGPIDGMGSECRIVADEYGGMRLYLVDEYGSLYLEDFYKIKYFKTTETITMSSKNGEFSLVKTNEKF